MLNPQGLDDIHMDSFQQAKKGARLMRTSDVAMRIDSNGDVNDSKLTIFNPLRNGIFYNHFKDVLNDGQS